MSWIIIVLLGLAALLLIFSLFKTCPVDPRGAATKALRSFLAGAWLWPVMLLAVTAGCDGSVAVRGRVLSAINEAIGGGEVSLGRPGDAVGFEGETDADGCFAVGGMVAPGQRDYFLTVSATGYQTFEGTFSSSGEYAVLVHLAPEASAGESTSKLLSDEEAASQLERCSW